MDLQAQLIRIGFTEYEAKVYLALLREYPATGYQISKRAGVPRSMVYEALGRLHSRGAVLETADERVTRYRPLPPDVLLDQHEQAVRCIYSDLRSGLGALYKRQQDQGVWTVAGRGPTLAYAQRMLQQADHELFLVLADPDLAALEDAVAAAAQRGVAIGTVLTGKGALPYGRVVRHPPLESEMHQLLGMLLVVADGQEALVASDREEITATITRNRNLVLIARQFVWMELFAQRVFAALGPDLLAQLDVEDRAVFTGVVG